MRILKLVFMILSISCLFFVCGCDLNQNELYSYSELCTYNQKVLDYSNVKDSLIRFHVIANSDSEEDQNLKIKVKNKIINYLYPYLSESESLDQSRKIILQNIDKVKKIAQDEIKLDSYNYDVDVKLSRENFPEKSYGNIILPQGNYEAFRVIIGKGEGKNWWCVMFPPLCFVDESMAEIKYNETEEKISNSTENNKDNDEIQIKFKLEEILKNLFN
ncbi:stage II sporulation protein R [Clostridium sp. BJN0001]|uniref:stage II sporulation protein R n=1 Tax=Clostridium sp. BJN0001 TaxID=2930219 RepID=UPI001FD469FD|nr:stage II sporulation protein R [Clostridium sp. BJN0001]